MILAFRCELFSSQKKKNIPDFLLFGPGHNLGKIEDYILSLYRSGNTENDIVNILSQTEGIGLSASTIQKINRIG